MFPIDFRNDFLISLTEMKASFLSALLLVSITALAATMCSAAEHRFDYIVVGAGPSGLQMGYYLQRANRNYVILERNVSGIDRFCFLSTI